jgi:hypothetical protein
VGEYLDQLGKINSRYHFHDNDGIVCNLMKEWVRPASGDDKGSGKIEKHTANHFTNHVNRMLVNKTTVVQILFEVMKLFQSPEETSLQNARFKWYGIRESNCGSSQETWDTVSRRVHNANLCIPGTAQDPSHRIYSYGIIMRFIGLAQKYLTGEEVNGLIQKMIDGEATGILVETKNYTD